MAVTGQFGRALTGSGSLSSAISSIASEFVTLRMNRIYDAFISQEALDGTVIDAQTAISELKKLMAGTTEDTRTGQGIADMMRAVRKANRIRTLNKFDADLAEMGAEKGDYGARVRAIQEMLLDPTLNPDDTSELRNELSEAVREMLLNARNQYSAGKKITMNGKTVDFTGNKNQDQFLALFDDVAKANPDMADKIIRQKYEAEATVSLALANQAWLGVTRTTNAQKLQGFNEQLQILRAAYKKLEDAGLATGETGMDLLEKIRAAEGYAQTSQNNIADENANKRISNVNEEVYGDLYAIDDALTQMGVNVGEGGIANLLLSNPNAAYRAIDMAIAMNGGSTKINVNGKIVEIDRDTIYAVLSDTKAAAVSANNWAKNNPSVSEANKVTIRGYVTSTTALFNNVPNLKIEDAYDNARTALESALEANPDDINARVNALKAFGKALRALAGTAGNSGVKTALNAEADLFQNGTQPKKGVMVYGEWSGNFAGGENGESALSVGSKLGELINPRVDSGDVSISEGIALIYNQHAAFSSGAGSVYIDGITGERVASAIPEDLSAYDNLQSMKGTTMVSNTFGGVDVNTQHDATYARYRIVKPDFSNTGAEGLRNATIGWVSVITDSSGRPIEVVLFRNKGGGSSERVIDKALVDGILATIGANMFNIPLRQVGQNTVVVANSAFISAIDGVKLADTFSIDSTQIASGDADFWNRLVTEGGYTSPTTFKNLEIEGFYKLIDSGKLLVRTDENGKVLVFVDGGDEGRGKIWKNITTSLSPTLLGVVSEASRLIESELPPPGGVPGYEGDGTKPDDGGEGFGGGGGKPGAGGYGTGRGGSADLIARMKKLEQDRKNAEIERAKRLAPEMEGGRIKPVVVRDPTVKPPVTPVKNPTLDGYAAIEKSRENQAMLGTFMRNLPSATPSAGQPASGGAQGKKILGVERITKRAL
jgi:tetratricopeptide (TPR) repeat protein